MSFAPQSDTTKTTSTKTSRARRNAAGCTGIAAAAIAALAMVTATPATASPDDIVAAQAQYDEAQSALATAKQHRDETKAARDTAEQKAAELKQQAEQARGNADEATRAYLRLLREGAPSAVSLVTQAFIPGNNDEQDLLSGLSLADKTSDLFAGNTNVSDMVTTFRATANEKTQEATDAEAAAGTISLDDTESAVAAAETDAANKNNQLETTKKRDAEERALAARSAAEAAEAAESVAGATPEGVTPTSSGWVKPVAGRISSDFGPRAQPVPGVKPHHDGVDLSAPEGTPIHAANAGTVIEAGYQGSYGNWVLIDHGNGIKTGYGHMKDGGIKVSVGQKVEAGTLVGLVGSTGAATGSHLHFEVRSTGPSIANVRSNGMFLDPVAFMQQQGINL